MPQYTFRTNLKCGGCVATVTPALNALPEVKNWKVDLESPEKTLTVDAESGLSPNRVEAALTASGYRATLQ